jgi:hypothetical protein
MQNAGILRQVRADRGGAASWASRATTAESSLSLSPRIKPPTPAELKLTPHPHGDAFGVGYAAF